MVSYWNTIRLLTKAVRCMEWIFTVVEKTGGADDYYNNDWYPGWVHWGMTMANPLIASPIYNKDGDMSFKYNRIRAFAFRLEWRHQQ